MIGFVERKFVIYVGKQTINGILFEKAHEPKPFAPYTMEHKNTEKFFDTGILNEDYIKAIITGIMSFVSIYEYDKEDISIYISSELRVTTDENDLLRVKGEIFSQTGIHSFVLTDELEELYIRNLIPTCTQNRIILRIMSTSTNMYFISENGYMIKHKLDRIGASTILSLIPGLRQKIGYCLTAEMIREYVEEIKIIILDRLDLRPQLLSDYKLVIYLGGEIDFMRAWNYDLRDNTCFEDVTHPYMLDYNSFYKQSCEKILIKSQKYLDNEDIGLSMKWKAGMKPCTLIAMALFEILEIRIIIPSNLKEFYGMHYKNFDSVVITGSKRVNGEEISEWIQYFEQEGVQVCSPVDSCEEREKNNILRETYHLQAINKCDTLIVCNSRENGYIGDATLFDIGYAMARGKRVITTRKPSQDVFNLIAVEIGIYRKD